MFELDTTVRQNQLAHLPIAKSGRAEAELLDSYPQLAEIIERGRRAMVDQIAFRSRWRHEGALGRTVLSRSGITTEDEDKSQFPPSRRQTRTLSDDGSFHRKSPRLLAKASTADLMFDMDDNEGNSPRDPALQTPNEIFDHSLGPEGQNQIPGLTAEGPWLTASPNNRSIDVPSSTSPGLPHAEGSQQSVAYDQNPPTDSRKPPALIPWGNHAMNLQKLDMKTIMTQASSNQVSNISTGLSSLPSTSSNIGKLTQRERKRQQQKAALQQPQDVSIPHPVEPETEQMKSGSPWQVASSGTRMSLKEILSAESISPSPSRSKSDRTVSNPPLTLRQTVPGNMPTIKRTASEVASNPYPIPAQRNTSTPTYFQEINTPPRPSPSRTIPSQHALTIGPSNTPTSKSIRYNSNPALAAEPSLQLSMADILSQQQTEKDVFKEAVAKRSLQEIQEEQAFQEWWDQESRKVMEEEQQQASAAVAVTPANRGKGGNRGSGRGRGNGVGEEKVKEKGKAGRSGKRGESEGAEGKAGRDGRGGGNAYGRGNTRSRGGERRHDK